jgi:hypothetical protein
MIVRTLQARIVDLARRHPVVTLTGPRQSGKTTLCRMAFPKKAYVSLEAPDVRRYAREDPRGFLAEHARGAVFDEVQHVPDLLSYLQGEVDDRPTPGRFILTGSRHFGLLNSIGQSLAGRTALVNLFPLGLDELRRFPRAPDDLLDVLWRGAYPPIHHRRVPADEWLGGYVQTYLERDVRQVLNVGDLAAFQTFLGLCAGRTAQLLNLSSLGADCGISHNTARAWMSVLETSFIVHRLAPFHTSRTTRLVKTPKLHFFDSGLVCHLLGIRSPGELQRHPLRGAIFESWVVSEIVKARAHRGVPPSLCFYRDRKGNEVDAVLEVGHTRIAVEVKSGATLAADVWGPVERMAAALGAGPGGAEVERVVVYGGVRAERRRAGRVLPWAEVDRFDWVRAPARRGRKQ